MGNKKATGFLCLRLVPCFAYVGAEDNRKGIPFVKIVSLLCKLIQFLMVALSVTVHKALILLVFLNHPYQSLAFCGFLRVSLYIVYYLKFPILSIINNLFYNLSQSIALYLKVYIGIRKQVIGALDPPEHLILIGNLGLWGRRCLLQLL